MILTIDRFQFNKEEVMFKSFSVLAKHMQEEHPDAEYFGDSCVFNENGVVSQKCFICGKELVNIDETLTNQDSPIKKSNDFNK